MSVGRRSLLVGSALIAGLAPGVGAQTALDMAAACIGAVGDGSGCSAAALAAQTIAADMALGAGLGSDVAGTSSNLGRRVGSMPRIDVGARIGLVRTRVPDLDATALAERSIAVPAVGADVAVGLFDGFRLAPTVGGFLAVDLFGRVGVVLPPEEEGFGDRTAVYSVGARVGLLRESFTLPGVSVSLARRFVGDVSFGGAPDLGDPAHLVLGPSATSLRVTVGKDVGGFGLVAGFGYDALGADVDYEVAGSAGLVVTAASTSIDASRRLYFVSGSRAFGIVLTLVLEAGLADGFDPLPDHVGAFDPTRGSLFGSAAFRLTI